MSRLFRGIAWRKGQATSLFVLGTFVTAGCLVAARFSELTDTSVGSVGVLVVLGVVALSAQAAESARARRHEIALAQIRGRRGLRLFGFFLAEPVMIVAFATVSGVLLGRLVTGIAADRWLEVSTGAAQQVSELGWLAVGVAVLASLGAVLTGSWRTVRQPLVEQLDTGHRPRQAATMVIFGQTVVGVAAAVSAFQASQHAGTREGLASVVNPALLSPILLGLAAGQLAAWGLRGAAVVSSRRTASARQLGRFLAVRRLARRSDTIVGTRLVIAAAVVTAVTASATSAVGAWQDESTRLSLGGPRQLAVAGGALAAYQASRAADPAGHWLMAIVSAPDQSEPYRRVFVDSARWRAVVGDFLHDTGADEVSQRLKGLTVGSPVHLATGNTISAAFSNASVQATRGAGLTVQYVGTDGSVRSVSLTPGRPKVSIGSTTITRKLRGCARGCAVMQLTVDGYETPGGRPFVVIRGLDLGGQSVLDSTKWVVRSGPGGEEPRAGSGLRVRLNRAGVPTELRPVEATQRLAALTTRGLELHGSSASPITYAVDGSQHPVDVVGHLEALPLLGRSGALLDLPRALAGGGPTIAEADAVIVARADTPQAVLEDLDASGLVQGERDFASTLDQAQRRPDVQGVRLYTLMSLFGALIAIAGLGASVNAQRSERRREAASLRVTGVRVRHINAAYRREALWLSAGAFVSVTITGWLAARLTLGGLALVPETPYSPALQHTPPWVTVVLVAVGAALAVGVVTLSGNRRVAHTSPPSMLRDDLG